MTATMTAAADVHVDSKLLGPLRVMDTQVYAFPQEPYGFPGARHFALMPAERDGFFWLQCLEFEALTFLLIDPFRFVDGYAVDVGPEDLGTIAGDDPSDMLVLSILTLPRSPEETATVNLQGPIVLNVSARLGRQLVVESPYGIRYPVEVKKAS